jgi:hypothetical protein
LISVKHIKTDYDCYCSLICHIFSFRLHFAAINLFHDAYEQFALVQEELGIEYDEGVGVNQQSYIDMLASLNKRRKISR